MAGKSFWTTYFHNQFNTRRQKALKAREALIAKTKPQALMATAEAHGIAGNAREYLKAKRAMERAEIRFERAEARMQALAMLALVEDGEKTYPYRSNIATLVEKTLTEMLAGNPVYELPDKLLEQEHAAIAAFDAATTPKQYQKLAEALADEYDLDLPDPV